MNFNGDLRKIGDIDITRFAQHAAKITDADWTADAFRQKTYEVHKQTQTIRLIMDEDGRHRVIPPTIPRMRPIRFCWSQLKPSSGDSSSRP